jgi:hypothetical protein
MKKGDNVVCINDTDVKFNIKGITIGKIYKITKIYEGEDYDEEESYGIVDDNGHRKGYFSYRFISLKEYRKQKLEKINKYRIWRLKM